MMDMLIKDYTPEDGSSLSFEKLIEQVHQKFSLKINIDDIHETLKFLRENVLNSDFLIFFISISVGPTPNVPYIKGELEPEQLNSIKNLLSQFNKMSTDKQAKYFLKRLSRQQMSLLSVALMKNLFPRPKRGQLLVDVSSKDDESTIFIFENQYYDSLSTSIENAYKAGSFAKSNNEMEWIDLKNAVKSASGTNKIDLTKLTDHPLTE